MTSKRRLDFILPIVTLIVSFVGVLALGHIFTTGEVATTRPQPPEPTTSTPSAARAQITVHDLRIEITLRDLSTEDPAPGLLQTAPAVGVGDQRICLTDVVGWVPTDAESWIDDGAGTPCRGLIANGPSGQLMMILEKR